MSPAQFRHHIIDRATLVADGQQVRHSSVDRWANGLHAAWR
jgi:hypothetical protein